jgi:iron-sulfur cluster repair protein YtfE (RIC family)
MKDNISMSGKIVEVLILDHVSLLNNLSILSGKLQSFPEVYDLFDRLNQLLRDHLMKEEHILFPNIISLENGGPVMECGFSGPIQQMLYEHEMISYLEYKIRCLSNSVGELEKELLCFLDDLAVHKKKEDEELFPMVLQLSQ